MDFQPIILALSALMTEWLQPFNVMLLAGIILFVHFLWKANKRADFSMVDSLREDDGKASAGRVVFYGAFIASTWAIMQCAGTWMQQPTTFMELFGLYIVVWAIPKVATQYIQARYAK
jgi:hypothetical protein